MTKLNKQPSRHHQLIQDAAFVLGSWFAAFTAMSHRRQLRRVRMWGETPSHHPAGCVRPGQHCAGGATCAESRPRNAA